MFHRTISLLGSPVGVVRSSTGLSSLPSAMALLPGILKASNRPKNSHVKSICTLRFSKLLAPENPVGNVHRLSVEVTSIDGEVCPRWGQLHPLGSLKSLGMNRVWYYIEHYQSLRKNVPRLSSHLKNSMAEIDVLLPRILRVEMRDKHLQQKCFGQN